jgi:hypothetical protein
MMEVQAATTYVQMSREDIEGWLDEVGFRGKWKLSEGRTGVYLLNVGPNVAIKFSSTVAATEQVVGYANASMQLSLVSTFNGRVLNKKAQGQDHFKRTKGWRQTWKDGLDRMREAYIKAADFYNKLAVVDENYTQQKIKLIEGVPGWEQNPFLSDLHLRVERGGILSDKQEEAVLRFLGAGKVSPKDDPAPSDRGRADAKKEQELDLQPLRNLYAAARSKGDQWTMDFSKSIADQLKAGKSLSDKQRNLINAKLDAYGIP